MLSSSPGRRITHPCSSINAETVIIKTAPIERLQNEREMLNMFQRCPHIRPMLDETEDPPALVLKYLDNNVLKASNVKKLKSSEI
jgi:casein kinase II subunit alpha